MISHSHPFKLIALCLLLLGPGGILEAASVKFIAMNEEIAGRKFGFKDSKGTTKLTDLTLLKRTKSYSCKLGKAPLELLEFNRADSPDKPVSTSITLPPDFKSALVLIMPDPKDPAALVGIALEDDIAKFAWGTMRFVNTTDQALVIRCEKEEHPTPASTSPVDVVPVGDARNMAMQVFKESNPAEILYSAVWEHDPNVRKLIVIVTGPDAATKPFDLSIVPETRPAKN